MGRQRLGKFRASLGKYLNVKRGLPCTMRQFMVRPARLRLNVPIIPARIAAGANAAQAVS
jgi:hypothetical protein